MIHKTFKYLVIMLLVTSCATNSVKNKSVLDYSKTFDALKSSSAMGARTYTEDELYLKASAASYEGDYLTANKYYSKLNEVKPNNAYIQKKYAVSLIREGKVEESTPLLVEVFSKTKDEQVGLVLAGVYTSLDNSKEAKKVYSQILTQNPASEDACVFLAKAYAVDQKTKKANSILNKCARAAKTNGIFDYYIGKMYVEQNKLSIAKRYFNKALKRDQHFSRAILAKGLILEEQGHKEKAVKLYKRYLRSHQDDLIVLNRIVNLLFSLEKHKEVAAFAERLLDLDPSNLNLKVKLGILYTDLKKYNQAIFTFKSLIKVSPDNDKLLYYLAAIYQETKDFESSIDYFSKIGTTSGLYADSSIQIASMLNKLVLLKKATEESFVSYVDKKIQELKELKVEFSVLKANYFEKIRRYSIAIETLKRVESEANFKNAHKFYLATLFEKEKRFEEAYAIMEGVLSIDPNNVHAMNFLGYSYVERGVKLKKAFNYLKQATTLSPKDGYIRDSLGWYYYKTGKMNLALRELNAAVALVKDDPSIQKHLAIVYSKLKKFKLAKKYLNEALKVSKDESLKKQLKGALKEIEASRFPASLK
ncbi:MAG: tetratricopeptide repeat protein [Bacteriovoracaceae bacterium]|nr:tetratricopeptide repeat protein [Bacteriovoracaceae bacterium]